MDDETGLTADDSAQAAADQDAAPPVNARRDAIRRTLVGLEARLAGGGAHDPLTVADTLRVLIRLLREMI